MLKELTEKMFPKPLRKVIGNLVYDTEQSEVIASDAFWDGRNYERAGSNTYLYRTKKGRYFKYYITANKGDDSYIKDLSKEEAITLYFDLKDQALSRKCDLPEETVPFDKAFPGVDLEDA